MARKRFGLFYAVHPFLKLATAVRPHGFYRRRWFRRIVLALGTAFFITWGFNPTAGIQIARPFQLPNEPATDSQANTNVSSLAQFAQSQPDAQTLLERGRNLYQAEQYSEAVTVLQQAAAAFQARGDGLGQAIALSNLSIAFQQLGQLEKALYYTTQTLNLLQVEPNTGDSNDRLQVLAQTLNVQGLLQLELGRAEQALETWKQAANTYNRVGDEDGRIRSLIDQAQAQQALGLYPRACTTLLSALEIKNLDCHRLDEQQLQALKNQPDSLSLAITLRSLGDVLQLLGELDKSLNVLQQSRNVAQRLQSPAEIAATLLSLGNTERALGNRAQTQQNMASEEKPSPLHCINSPSAGDALKYYQQAVESYQEAATTSSSPLIQIQAQLNQLSVLLKLQNWSEVQKLSLDLQPRLAKLPLSQTAIYARINFAQSLACLKQTTAADVPSWGEIAQNLATAVQQAKSIEDKRSEAYALGALGGVYLETQDVLSAQKLTEQGLQLAEEIKAADITYLWQWQLGHLLRIKGDIAGAIASYNKAVNTLKSLRSDLVALNPDVQFSFRDNVEPVYRQFVDLLLQPGDKGQGNPNPPLPITHYQFPVSQENLKLARDAIEALQVTELENFFQEACLQAKPQQIDEVVDKIDPTAAVIYPIILKDRLEIILKLPNQSTLRHYTTPESQSEVEDTLEKLQQYLREPDRIKDVKQLSQQVYGWLIQPLEAELGEIEVKTLVFVLDGYLRNIPMAVLYDEQQHQYLLEKYAIALAPGLQLIDPKPLQREQLNALTAGVSEKRQIEGREFAPLENVELELEQIQSTMPKSEELLNQTFTKPNLQNQIDSASFTVVHIATHGQFSSNAEETFILTWNALLKPEELSNLLRLSDQSESSAIELLVLSACQTAVGDKRAALGLAGIAVRAGARSTLATLWSVEDESTAELMTRFYQELSDPTLTKAEALRRAQLTLLTKDETPRFWAAYVLVGNWL